MSNYYLLKIESLGHEIAKLSHRIFRQRKHINELKDDLREARLQVAALSAERLVKKSRIDYLEGKLEVYEEHLNQQNTKVAEPRRELRVGLSSNSVSALNTSEF